MVDENVKISINQIAELYFNSNYTLVELTALLFALAKAPFFFKDNLDSTFNKLSSSQQLAIKQLHEQAQLEKNQIDDYYQAFISFKTPKEEVDVVRLLNKPNKSSAIYKALVAASRFLDISLHEVCYKSDLITDLCQFHIDSFMLEEFPQGINYNTTMANLPKLQLENNFKVKAFSIDSITTTEIDDAFSVQINSSGYIIGIHIAAPATDNTIEDIVIDNLSSIYYPTGKIMMLPRDITDKYSLKEGQTAAVVSIYFNLDNNFNIGDYFSRLETITIASNLRIEDLESQFNTQNLDQTLNYKYERELKILHNFALSLEKTRGKPSVNSLNIDYEFIITDKIKIRERSRGNPIDKLVSELMILANCSWGRMLTNKFIPAIYRVKKPGYPVKMTLAPDSHTGLNVSYYTWATSPLRRAVDYINQKQIISLILNDKNFYTNLDPTILQVVENFDKKYDKYLNFQNKMEKFWALKYLIQENISSVTATITYKAKAQIDGIPLEVDTSKFLDMQSRGTKLNLTIFNINIVTLEYEVKITK